MVTSFMRLPLILRLTGGWILAWITNALLAPVAANFLEMLGLLISVMVGCVLLLAAVGIVFEGVVRSWQMRSGKALIAQALVPAIVIALGVLFLTHAAAELSWQSLHGARDVPIWRWPYQP